jgi:MATE family multidrug resistance protein
MPALGIGTAVTALVGKYIGMGRPDLAERRAHLGFNIVLFYMLACGLGFFLFRHKLIQLFSHDPEVLRVGSIVLVFIAGYQLFDAMFVIYSSALRGAGDTLVPTIVQVTLVWSIVVGGGAAAAHFAPSYGVIGPWTLASLFGGLLGLYLFLRFRRGRWKTIRLHPEPLPTE